MAERETVFVEGTECYLFPVPLDTKGDPFKDAEFFLHCAYHRLYHMNQPGQQRSRELSLAITNIEQSMQWFGVHGRKHGFAVEFGIEYDPETGLPLNQSVKPEGGE